MVDNGFDRGGRPIPPEHQHSQLWVLSLHALTAHAGDGFVPSSQACLALAIIENG